MAKTLRLFHLRAHPPGKRQICFAGGVRLLFVLLLASVQGALSVWGQQTTTPAPKHQSVLRDPEDGWLDLSQLLAKPGRFVPVIMPVTEPAVGYGLAGAAVFLRPRTAAGSEGWARPNVTVAGGMYTSNQSWGLLAGDASTWKNGRIDTVFGGGHASINLKYFGEGGGSNSSDNSLEYNLRMSGILAKGRVRLGAGHWYAGLRYMFSTVESSPVLPDDSSTPPGDSPEPPKEFGRTDRLAGPALSLRYDSRNNVLTPTKGFFYEANWSYFDRAFGASLNFQRLEQVGIAYLPFGTRWTLGVRGDADFSFDNPVFYARPYVTLRGVPAMRYQRQHLAQTELELRWQFWKRFSAVMFGGGAVAWHGGNKSQRYAVTVGAGGVGFRYELARKFGLHYGIDFARGPEDSAIYFQFGSAWSRP